MCIRDRDNVITSHLLHPCCGFASCDKSTFKLLSVPHLAPVASIAVRVGRLMSEQVLEGNCNFAQ
eukprot:14971153-Heterocapsa_arctica.AAC.1